jgi:hypothetical protein
MLWQLLPFWATNLHMRWLARRTERRQPKPLTLAEAERIAQAVSWASRWWPWRVACLELSRGRFAAAALLHRRLVWNLHAEGIVHAYVTLPDGTPVAEPEFPVWPNRSILSI